MSGTIKQRINKLNHNIRLAQEPASESDEMHSLPFYEKGSGRTGGSRPAKGSAAAKARMAHIRSMRGSGVVARQNTYVGNGVVSKQNSYVGNGVVSKQQTYVGGLKRGYRKHPVGHITEHHSMNPMRVHPDRIHHEQLAHEIMMDGGFPFAAIAGVLGPMLMPIIADKIGQLIHPRR